MSVFKISPENILAIGIAFSFIYPPVSALFNPYAWVGYFPVFVTALPVNELTLLHFFGLLEIIIAFWILFGRQLRVPLILAVALLVTIVVFNLNQFDVLFRDIAIIGMCIALYLLHYPRTQK